MYSQRIPISPESIKDGYLTVSINFGYEPKLFPAAGATVEQNDDNLSNAERRVLQLISQPAKIIADSLNLSVNTVKKHISNMLDKTGCSSSRELAVWAHRNSMLAN